MRVRHNASFTRVTSASIAWMARWAIACAVVTSPWLSGTGNAQDDGGEGGAVLRCANVSAQATWRGYGYTHIVTLQNQCEHRVVCDVWTNVDPTPRHRLEAAPNESSSVITRGGSPGRDVRAESECRRP